MTSDPALAPYLRFNPLHGQPLNARADLIAVMERLLAPLDAYRSTGCARVQLSPTGAIFDHGAAELEGFARPLWAIAAASAGGDTTTDWQPYRTGLDNGTNPDHPEYWGDLGEVDQRLVELAAVGFALFAAKADLWDPLTPEAKIRVRAYLMGATKRQFSPNNWLFFRLLIDAGLRATGDGPAVDSGDDNRAALNQMYLGEGWYRDGDGNRVDHYVGFAFHVYGLLLHKFAPSTDKGDHLARARAFAPQFAQWFDDTGRGLPFGRSMTYRFAMTAFFGAYALADPDPVLPWGVLKGIVLRNLRWWANRPIADRDGVLSVGFGYANPHMAEDYNSPGSPYWAMKAFLVLAMPEDHPFWLAKELPLPKFDAPQVQKGPRFVLRNCGDEVTVLSGGQDAPMFRHGAEKYSKFSYSTAAPPCVEARDAQFDTAALDGSMAVDVAGRPWKIRQNSQTLRVDANGLRVRWRPFDDVVIDSWLRFTAAGHVRLHRIRSAVDLRFIEGGFASARSCSLPHRVAKWDDSHRAICPDGGEIYDLNGARQSRVHIPAANLSLLTPKVAVPQLLGLSPIGVCWFACYVSLGQQDQSTGVTKQ
ncbi:DUF2264 domain-containing protein [Pacificibacter marinus]|uniref:DUF2264 domain-containing protein n=1 Tax=Pacificibacter marinus TaxID=658057 RepID=UPI001C0715EB|nr:DUF2264 domain-containing protein [Pacificibacter marinus]MBU2867264.1 DUF2264 domain-containing protein [Pacificibacter marinus]